MSVRIGGRGSGGGFAALVAQAVAEHVEATEEQVERDVRDVTRQARAGVRSAAASKFGGTGRYAAGWGMRVQSRGGHVEGVVYHRTMPGLPHLLEKGHANRGGGRTPGREHIAPAYREAEAELLRRTGAR